MKFYRDHLAGERAGAMVPRWEREAVCWRKTGEEQEEPRQSPRARLCALL